MTAKTNLEREWRGRWINAGLTMGNPVNSMNRNAPFLRKTFMCARKPKKASVFLCGLGWHELYVNGHKADDRVLAPTVTQYDHHANYIEYDVTSLLRKGRNALTVLLGNGWYNCQTQVVWNMEMAPWRDYPKLLCDIVLDGITAVWSDSSWLVHDSPITFDALRSGQFYDARLEVPGFADPDLDDSSWDHASLCPPPGGRIERECIQPCKVVRSYPAVAKRFVSCWETTYDFGVNLTGWCRIKVRGEAGTQVEIKYAEQADPVSGHINTQEIDPYVKSGRFQTDGYILKGAPEGEEYEPSFTYHGFRYVQVWIYGKAEVLDIHAQFVHTAFAETGSFTSSDLLLNTLQKNTLQSFRSNFTGIPTDCPHREKNGWTGDAAVAAETGIWNFDMAPGFAHFLRILVDLQRPNGQLPGIAPTGGWGYNWGPGPAWDNVLFEYPWQVYLFSGKTDLIRQYYDNFLLYLEYCASRENEDGLLDFGLGDWCHWDRAAITPVEVTSSAYYYQNLLRTAFFADLLGRSSDASSLRSRARRVRKNFLRKFEHADGTFADNAPTANAAAVYFGLTEARKTAKTVRALVKQLRARQHKADFGILGSKYIPRVLAEHGFADDALEIITQKEFPGWGWQVEHGATSLWENWNGKDSRNHIMFGDISAWMYQYPGGLRPSMESPGFRRFLIQPCFVKKLDHVKVSYLAPAGRIRSEWRRSANGKITLDFVVPKGCRADLVLPDLAACRISRNGKTLGSTARTFENGSYRVVMQLA